VQGGKLAIANAICTITLIMAHNKMTALRAEASTAFVQRETGSVAGVARAMQAATAPTEGQRMLQAGFGGAILGGESREQSRTTTDAEGNVRVDRFVERSVLGEDGRPILLQQAQQCVGGGGGHVGAKEIQVPIEMATKEELDALKGDVMGMKDGMVGIEQYNFEMSQKVSKAEFDWRTTITHNKFVKAVQLVTLLEKKYDWQEQIADHKHNEAMKEIDAQRQQDKKDANAQREEDKKDANEQREEDNKKADAQREEDSKNANAQREQDKQEKDGMKAKMELLEATLKSLESAQAKAPKRAAAKQAKAPKEPAPKQPRLYWTKKDHPELPKNVFYKDGSFGWKKKAKNKEGYKAGFKSMAEAQASLALHLNGGVSRDVGEVMGGV